MIRPRPGSGHRLLRMLPTGVRAWLWRQLRLWHWVSSALCLATMLLFAFTGFTLNHAAEIASTPRLEVVDTVLPPELRGPAQRAPEAAGAPRPGFAAGSGLPGTAPSWNAMDGNGWPVRPAPAATPGSRWISTRVRCTWRRRIAAGLPS